jgi:hypothetical protein
MKLVKIGKTLRSLLLSDDTVAEYLTGKIFPLVAVEGTTFPFLVYRRSGYTPVSNKDLEDEIVTVEVAILSDKYETSVDVADAVLTGLHGSNEEIDRVKIIGTSEEFSDDIYIQKLIIDIYLK